MDQKKSLSLIILALILLDILFIIVADLATFIIRFNGQFPQVNFTAYLQLAFLIIISRVGAFYIFHLYEKPRYKSNFEILINTIKATTASSVIIVFLLYFMEIEAYPRMIAMLSWFLTIIFISSWRFVIKEFVGLYLGKGFLRTRLLVIGTDKQAQEVAMHALRDATVEYELLGFIATEKNAPVEVEKAQILGTMENLTSIIAHYAVDEVIVAEPSLEKHTLAKLTRLLSQKKITLKSLPSAYETVIANIMLSTVGVPFVGPTFSTAPASWYWGLKRILDIAFSLIIFIITLPIMLMAVILIKITSSGPIFYLQKRTGQNGRPFIIFKLRTMHRDAEKGRRERWAKETDERITPVGKLLRRFRIDELPQLVNVLRNEMSLIGPRPERPYFTTKLIKKIPFYAYRLQVKPGISGWAQVNFKYAASEEDTEKKLLYDLFYIQNMSFALDLLIALKTLKVVIAGQGAH